MIDWLTILVALVIIIGVVGFFGFLAWKINMSDPLSQLEINPTNETTNEKRRKEKNFVDQSKKKRKDQKKPKRENKDEDRKQTKTTEETDDEREESEQVNISQIFVWPIFIALSFIQELVNVPAANADASSSSKARKRNKNKPTTVREPLATHPKSTTTSTKQTAPAAPVPTKKTVNQQSNANEQPFTVVGGNRHKNSTQQNKTVSGTSTPAQHEQLAQRQQPLPVKETTVPVPVKPAPAPVPVKQTPVPVKQTPVPVKQAPAPAKQAPAPVKQVPAPAPSAPVKQIPLTPTKVADLIKVLPSSQAVVTELMSGLDAFPLSSEELDIIMHKIANKQSVVKQDWSKLQQGQKVDPQTHIGQALDESTKAYHDDMKSNSMKRVKDLTDELNEEKRRNNELLKDKTVKEREIQLLRVQLDATQQNKSQTNQSQQQLQTLQVQLQRLTEENLRLTQQQLQSIDPSNAQLQVLSEQIRKLSVDNANLEKKLHSHENIVQEVQKEKDDLTRYNEQLIQSLKNAEKDLKTTEEKHHQQLNETRTTTSNEIDDYKRRIQQLETENEQLKREEIVHVEPSSADIQTISINTEEREQFERDIQEYKQQIENLRVNFDEEKKKQ